MAEKFRKEKDVLGTVDVPSDVYWGVNTARTMDNFQISEKRFPPVFITSLAEIKKACLMANRELDLIDEKIAAALLQAMDELLVEEKHRDQFPIDVYQTGSGTQINMNMNEVLANRASEILGHPMGKKHPVHPNDHVNRGQSSNDVIPTAMHLSLIHHVNGKLIPALDDLKMALDKNIADFKEIVKVGRTHLQDAVPIPLTMEFEVYRRQVKTGISRLKKTVEELSYIPLGGTAVGTGMNAGKNFDTLVAERLSEISGYPVTPNPVKAEGIASHNTVAQASGQFRQLALSLMKMANDIRWMGSGPRAGLSELVLPQNEPGSSIMPGKINPTQSEALIQVCIQVIGNDTAVTFGEAHGSILDLNVSKPVMIYNALDSVEIMSNGIRSFINRCLSGLKPNMEQIDFHLDRMLMKVTNLTPHIGYDKSGEIALKAYRENKTIKEIIEEEGIEIEGNIDELLDPKKMV